MLNSDRFIFRALKNIAERKGYCFQTHSYGWIIEIQDRVRTFRLTGYTFDVNRPSGVTMARDKYATYVLLSDILPPDILIPSTFVPCAWKEEFIGVSKATMVSDFTAKYAAPYILKDMTGSQGNNVFRIENEAELQERMDYFESIHCDALLSPYIASSKELRVILLDDEVHLAYYKLASGGWKFNLSQGAETSIISEEEYGEILPMIEYSRVIMRRLGLRFASCDFFILPDGSFRFLEVNGGVCVDRFVEQNPEFAEKLERMYEEAMEKSFMGG